jgi:hypothetical protein
MGGKRLRRFRERIQGGMRPPAKSVVFAGEKRAG